MKNTLSAVCFFLRAAGSTVSPAKRSCRHQGKVQEDAHLLYGKIRNDIVELLQVGDSIHPVVQRVLCFLLPIYCGSKS
jgi:hypothetical protein